MSERQNSSTGPYCICRSYDDSRFMICCDRCNQWFHGDCVKIKADEAKIISNFYCPNCQKVNPALQTVYRSSPSSPAAIASPKPNSGMPTSSSAPSLAATKPNGTNVRGVEKILAVAGMEMAPKSASGEPSTKRPKLTTSASDTFKCGNCIGCFRKENCGRCDVCKREMAGDQICLLRRCVIASSGAGAAIMKPVKAERTDDSEDDDPSFAERKKPRPAPKANAKLKNVTSRKDTGHERKVGRPPKNKAGGSSTTLTSSGGTRATSRAYKNFLKDAGVLPNSDDDAAGGSSKPKQCYGPGCIYAARPLSKYCSDECGLKLAQLRVQLLLPSRMQQFYGRPPVADQYESRRRERIKGDLGTGRARLDELDQEERELTAWKEKCKTVRLKENDGGKGTKSKAKVAESDDPETSVYCVTCGNETSMKNAIKHFAKCFSKYESQTSYGSSFKAVNNLYNIFCDTYNKANRTYCKRLRIICPEHSKEDRVEPHEICGCPLQPDGVLKMTNFDLATMCTILKKNCTKHYRWMQIRRALIDMERLSQLLRLEELAEEDRCIKMAQNSRGSLLGLLLHGTMTHEEEVHGDKTEKEYESDKIDTEEESGTEETNGEEITDGDQRSEKQGNSDQQIDKQVDVVPKYPEEGVSRKLEDGWAGVYGNSV